MSNNDNARYKELRVERKIQTQTSRYVSRFELLRYVPAFTQKDFRYVHTGAPTKGPPLRNYKYKSEYTTLLSLLYIRGRHKA